MKAMKPHELKQVNVDTTVQEKAIAFPTDARLYQKMRVALIRKAKQLNIRLRQSYRFVVKKRCSCTVATPMLGRCVGRPR